MRALELHRYLYKTRNEVERLLPGLKGFRRIFTRCDKLEVVFAFFIHFALMADALMSVNTPWTRTQSKDRKTNAKSIDHSETDPALP